MLRSSRRIQAELRLRNEIERLASEIESPEPFEVHARAANERQIELVSQELTQVSGDLEWALRGPGVYGNSVALDRLVGFVQPLGRSLHWIGRDLRFREGRSDLVGHVEPVLTGTFAGSFGLRVSQAVVVEQMSLEGSLFDRSVTLLLGLFSAAQSPDPATEIMEAITGLRANSISALRNLSQQVIALGEETTVRWRGETIVPVAPHDAEVLLQALEVVEPSETEVEIVATLRAGDLDSGRFHLVELRPDGSERHYRGYAAEELASVLMGIELGSRVRATLTVVETYAPFMPRPAASYVLRSVEALPSLI